MHLTYSRTAYCLRRTHRLALHAVYCLHGVIATCVAHQYSIVKELLTSFQKSRLGTWFNRYRLLNSEAVGYWHLAVWHTPQTPGIRKLPSSPELARQPTAYRRACDCKRILVGLGRLELPTSPLSGVRSNHLSYRPKATNSGGAGRDRTGDLLNANQALSQLSYSPLVGIRDWGLGTGAMPS